MAEVASVVEESVMPADEEVRAPVTATSPATATGVTGSSTRVHGTRTATGNAPAVKREREWPGAHVLSRPPPTPQAQQQQQQSAKARDIVYDGPPTPVSLPSFVHDDPPSDDEDSSSDEDEEGEPKPPRAPVYDSRGRARPTPAYYYDPEYDLSGAPNRKRGRRGGMKGIPVFEPSMEEFEHGFYDYVKRIEKYGMRSGIVKVVPPKEWHQSLPNVSEPLRKVRLKDAIEQHMVGSSGLYRVTNVAKSRIWNPAQWKETSELDKFQTPDFVKDAHEKGERGTRSTAAVNASNKRKSSTPAAAAATATSASKETADSRRRSTRAVSTQVIKEEKTTAKKASPMAKAEPTDAEWDAFMKKYDELPHGMRKEDYTVDMMREIERRYWRGLVFGNAPMYGADMAGSIFDDATEHWNVAKLGDLLGQLAPSDCQIPGVVSPYLYFGMWRATFAWHVEDADLYSINYIHFGAPKFWYAIPQEQAPRFERVMEGWFPTDRAKCNQFLRHKAFLASPHKLAEAGVTLNRCVQLPGEFILTYPKGYHSGFNVGFNCAESINFATERWIPIGKAARSCTCVGDSVSINVEAWLHEAAEEEHAERDPSYKKRPYEQYLDEREAKRRKVVRPSFVPPTPPPAIAARPAVERISKKAQAEIELQKKLDAFVCALCPDTSTEGLVEIGEPGQQRQANNNKPKKAHRVCVMFTPSTWIDTDPDTGTEIVRGFDNIEKARWKLKCQLCTEKYGCKVQCTRGKCIKAFHVTCALKQDSGTFIDATVSIDADSATANDTDTKTVSMLDQVRAELDAEKETGSPVMSKVAIPERSAPMPPSVSPPVDTATDAALGTAPVAAVATAASEAPNAQVTSAPAATAITETALPPTTAPATAVQSTAPTAKAKAAIVDTVEMGNMRIKVLCRQHNPEWQKLEAQRKAAELKDKVLALTDGERIGVRTPGGVFEVTLLSKNVERESVFVASGEGKRSEIKWKNILWVDAAELKLRQEAAERARREKDSRMYVYDHRPIQPTKRQQAPYPPPPGFAAGPYGFAPRWHAYAGGPPPPPSQYTAYGAALGLSQHHQYHPFHMPQHQPYPHHVPQPSSPSTSAQAMPHYPHPNPLVAAANYAAMHHPPPPPSVQHAQLSATTTTTTHFGGSPTQRPVAFPSAAPPAPPTNAVPTPIAVLPSPTQQAAEQAPPLA